MELTMNVLEIPDPQSVCRGMEDFIFRKVREFKKRGAVIPYSGGKDSTLVVCLCARALGAENVLALYMPTTNSKTIHRAHVVQVTSWLGVKLKEIDITPTLREMGVLNLLPEINTGVLEEKARREESRGESFVISRATIEDDFVARGLAYAGTQNRLRADYLAMVGELKTLLTVGAGNYTEYRLGASILWGCDERAHIMPIRLIYRTQVRQLLRFLGLPPEISDKQSDPDVIIGIDNIDQIFGPSEENDLILWGLDNGISLELMYQQLGREAVIRVTSLIEEAFKYLRNLPHIPSQQDLGGLSK